MDGVERTRIELRVLGARELVDDSGVVVSSVVAQPKRFALLAYLILDGPFGTHSRDELLAMFWPEQPAESARNSLTQALSFLRRALGPNAIVNIGRDAVRVNASMVECDATRLLAAIDRGAHADAVLAYKEPLLPGLFIAGAPEFERWLDSQRARFHGATLRRAEQLVARAREQGDIASAIEWATVGVRLEPCSEKSARTMMEVCVAAGERSKALQAFDAHAESLRTELEASPSANLFAFREEIRLAGIGHTVSPMNSADHAGAHADALGHEGAVGHEDAGARVSRFAPTATAVLTGIAALLVVSLSSNANSGPQASAQLNLVLDDSVRLRADLVGSVLAIDAAGRRIAYVGGTSPERIYVRALDDPTPRAVLGSEHARFPRFTADGGSVAFTSDDGVRVASIDRGEVQTLVNAANRFSLAPDGSVVHEPSGDGMREGLWITRPGQASRRLTAPDRVRREISHGFPFVLHDGKSVLFQIRYPRADSSELAIARIADGVITRLGITGTSPRFVSPDLLVFGRHDGGVAGMRFDPAAGRALGRPVRLLLDVRIDNSGDMQFALADSGTLVYLPAEGARQLMLYDGVARTSRILSGPGDFAAPRLSPDGRRIAVTIGRSARHDVWILAVDSGALTRFTFDGKSSAPSWTPDGRALLWSTGENGKLEVWSQPTDKSEPPRRVAEGAASAILSRSSEHLIVPHNAREAGTVRGEAGLRIMQRDRATGWNTTAVLDATRFSVSPDGRLLAYVSAGLHVRELDAPYRSLTLSLVGSSDPVWIGDRELLYLQDGRLVAAQTDWSSRPVVHSRRQVSDDFLWHRIIGNDHFDVTRDGTKLVVVETAGDFDQPRVVLNWMNALRERFDRAADR